MQMLTTKMSICTEYQSEQDLGLLFQDSTLMITTRLFTLPSQGPLMSRVDVAPTTLTLPAAQAPPAPFVLP